MTTTPSSIVCAELSFRWPDGTPVLDRLDLALGSGRTGLVGRNGAGKSTLLRLIAGELAPSGGTIRSYGAAVRLPQELPLDTGRTVADLLGISDRRAALHAISAGDADPAKYTELDDDWEVEARAVELLDRLGVLPSTPGVLDRPVGALSGGETVLTAVAGLLVRRAPISLLDEPTNNLDARARELLYAAIADWPGVLVVVSHDRELLERMDEIVELRDGSARTFGGPYSSYVQTLAAEQQTAARRLRAAEGALTREQRHAVEASVRLAASERYGKRAAGDLRVDKSTAQFLKRRAQQTAGKSGALHADRVATAQDALGAAERVLRDDDRIRVDLPATAVPAGRTVLQVGTLTVRGPERIALIGDNGSGKTTLLEAISGRRDHPSATIEPPPVPVAYLPQRLDLLDDGLSVLDNVRAMAPDATPHDVRARLARFLVRGDRVERAAGTLSGGERFRVSLACLLLADPAPQLLLLDEPTNNLDLDSVAQLSAALTGYRGALVVASHDRRFLIEIGVEHWWLTEGMQLPREVAAPA
jgi:ATPase subunit of ABC transporter with duplicated ATPase domains